MCRGIDLVAVVDDGLATAVVGSAVSTAAMNVRGSADENC